MHEPDGEDATPKRFEYFMIRLTRSDRTPDRVAGQVERLGSGEKRSFESGDQLLQMVGGWFAFNFNLQPSTGRRNPGDDGPTNSSLGDGS